MSEDYGFMEFRKLKGLILWFSKLEKCDFMEFRKLKFFFYDFQRLKSVA